MEQLGGEEADVAAAGGKLEDRLAGLGLEAVDHPVRDRQRAVVEGVGAGLPACRDALPTLAAGGANCFGIIHARSLRRAQVAAQELAGGGPRQWVGDHDVGLGDLEAREPGGAVDAEVVGGGRLGVVTGPDERDDGLPTRRRVG